MASAPDNSTAPETPEDTPTPSPGPEAVNKFNWLKQARTARNNPFVKPRPSLTRESSSAELFSRENSTSDFFQSSRLNLFETAPKPEVSQGYHTVTILSFSHYFLDTNVFLFSCLFTYLLGY